MALGDIKHSKRKRFGNGGEEGRWVPLGNAESVIMSVVMEVVAIDRMF